VNEAEFGTCADPEAMLTFLLTHPRAAERKFRLFAVACCRAAWRLFTSKAVRAAVEAGELYADGRLSRAALRDAQRAAEQLAERAFRKKVRASPWTLPVQGRFARQAAVQVASEDPDDVLDIVTFELVAAKTPEGRDRACRRGQLYRADLLRDLFGPLPFRPVHIDPSWRTPAVVALASAISDERRWGDLPILGDALQEAGCTDAEVLEHCRGPGPHSRGCWVCDLLLMKE
jgi:hypothetical protein